MKNARKLVVIIILFNFKILSKFSRPIIWTNSIDLTVEQYFWSGNLLQTGFGSVLTRTAGSGSAKNKCGYIEFGSGPRILAKFEI